MYKIASVALMLMLQSAWADDVSVQNDQTDTAAEEQLVAHNDKQRARKDRHEKSHKEHNEKHHEAKDGPMKNNDQSSPAFTEKSDDSSTPATK